MKHKFFGKALSLILAFAMCISLMPQIPVFADTTAAKSGSSIYVYDFGAKGYQGIVSETIDKAWIVANGDAESPVFAEAGTAAWFVDGSTNVYDNRFALTNDTPGSNQMPNCLHHIVATNAINGGSATVIRIKIPEAGVYNPSISFYAYNGLCKYKAYLVPATKLNDTYKSYVTFSNVRITNNLMPQIVDKEEKYFLGEFDMYADTTTKTLTTNDFGGKTYEVLPEDVGEYYLILRTNGATVTPTSTLNVNLDSFTLAALGAVSPLKTVEASLTSDVIRPGSSTNINLTLKNEDGEEYTEPCTIVYESLDKAVATVDENGVVTGVSDGKAKIKVTVTPKTDGATPVSSEVEVTVESENESGTFYYDFGYKSYGLNSVIPISTDAVKDTAAVGAEGYVANTVSLARFATDKNFASVNSAPWLAAGMKYVLDMKAKENELWVQAYRTRLTATTYGFMLMIDVPAAGEYTPMLEYQALANSYVNHIILIPEDDSFITSKTASRPIGFWNLGKDPAVLEGTDGASAVLRDMGTATREKYTLGTLDMQETTPDEVSEYKVFPNVTLEKKRYYLFFDSAETQTTDSSSTGNKLETVLRSFTLAKPGTIEIPSFKTVEASLSSDIIRPGSSAKVNLTLKYEDGTAFTDPYTATYESLDNNVATVDENGVVTGVSDGKTKIKITVTANHDGAKPVSSEVEVTVETEKLPETLHYNFGYESYGLNSDIPISTDFTKDTAEVGAEGYVENTISIARFAKDKKWATVNTSPWLFEGMRYLYSAAIKSNELWISSYERYATTTTHGFLIAIDVPVAGEYTPVLNYQALSTGYINNILLVPADDARFVEKITAHGMGFWREDIQSLEGNGGVGIYLRDLRDVDRENYQLGKVDMQEATPDDTIERKVFNNVKLEKKKYYLIFDPDGQAIASSTLGSNKIELSLRSFDLHLPGEVALPVLGSASISFADEEVYIGETISSSLDVRYDDGQTYTEAYTISYESLTPSVASVDENGVVTGISEGKAKIKVTITPEKGEPITGEGEINVVKKLPLTAKVYKFGYSAYGATENIPAKSDFAKDTAEVNGEGYVPDTLSLARFVKDNKFAETDTTPWLYSGMRYVLDSILYSDNLWVQSYRARVTLTSHGFMMLIDVPQKGTYSPVLEYQALKNGYINDVLLIPADDARFQGKSIGFWRLDNQVFEGTGDVGQLLSKLTDADREKYRLGTVNMQEANPDDTSEYKVFSDVELEKKKYYLIFDTVGQKIDSDTELGAGNKIEVSLRSFRLELPGEFEIPVLDSVELSFGKQSLPVTRNTNAVLTMKYDDGDSFVEDCKVSYESLNDCATIDADGNITAVSEGIAKFRVTVTPDYGKSVSAEAELPITSKPVLYSFRFTEEEISLLAGDEERGKYETGIIAVMSDSEEETAEPYEVFYKSADESIATVDENGVITAVAVGRTTVEVYTTSPEERLCTGTISVVVYADMPGITVDFSKTVFKEDKSLPDITPGYKILANEGTVGSFSLGTVTDTGLSFLYANTYSTKYWPADNKKQTAFAISVNADIEGWYKTELIGALHKQGAFYSIYTEEDYLGDRSFWNGAGTDETKSPTTGKETALNTVYLHRGENKIYMRIRRGGTGNPYAIVNSLKFIPVPGEVTLSRVDATFPDELAVGETFEGEAVAFMSDGTVRHFGDLANDGSKETVRVMSASADNEGVEVSGLDYVMGKTGVKEYVITGKSVGKTKVEILAKLSDDNFAKASKEITITDDLLTSTSLTMAADELFAGDMTYLTAHPIFGGKRESSSSAITNTITSSDESVVTVEGNLLRAVSVGKATLTVTSTFNGKSVSDSSFTVEVLPEGMTDIELTSGGSKVIKLTDNENETIPAFISAISNLGNVLDMENAVVSVRALNPEIADIADGRILPVSEGEAKFLVRIELDGRIREKECSLRVSVGKTKATYMTAEKAEAARENMAKYDWAKKEATGYARAADKYIDHLDALYDMIHSEGIPRGASVGYGADPAVYKCRYCNLDLRAEYSSYPWVYNALVRPWKIQCPDCKRVFPTNDFGSFYKLGLNEYGEFSRDRALEEHAKLFGDTNAEPGSDAYYGYGNGYLKNTLYRDIENEKSINGGLGLRPGETVDTWGVDDGFGYVPKKPDGTPYTYNDGKDIERHSYIAAYLHWGVWRNGAVGDAIEDCAYAYFYTGDKKYGRIAAILLDRLADFYPDYDLLPYFTMVGNSHGGSGKGKLIGNIWETGIITNYIKAYDMVYDMYDDPFVLEYISEKNSVWKMRHSKENASQIRTNVEDGILRAAFEGIKSNSVSGNFGMEQKTNAYAAVILDDAVESLEWIDFLMASGWDTEPKTGGGIFSQLVDEVDADGQGNEASSYNVYWLDNLRAVNEAFEGSRFDDRSFNNNPKYMRMFYANIPLMAGTYSPHIGDTGATASVDHWVSIAEAKKGWQITGDPIFAQVLYRLNGNSAKGLRYGITDKNPESLEREVENAIAEHGVLNLKSDVMTNFGFAILRDGGDFTNSTIPTAADTQRNAWMYFGANGGHGHSDTLNLGLTAFGLNLLPDLGYPEQTGTQPNRLQWVSATMSHNTATVNGIGQTKETEVRGKLLHFDGTEAVQVMDVSTPYVYKDVSEYRRSVMTVKVDDNNSYTVDFFRILGGNDHILSIHAQSNEVVETEGLDFSLVEDENGKYVSGSQLDEDGNYKGTMAGRDATYIKNTVTGKVRLPDDKTPLGEDEVELPVEFGPDPNSPASWSYTTLYPRGFTWLKNVDRDTEPENNVEIDLAIKDFNRALKDGNDIHLRMTILSGGNTENGGNSEIAIADGLPPQVAANKKIDKLKYILVKNGGENLDTVFTTVYEPYRENRYLESVTELSVSVSDGEENTDDAVRALKVSHISGRCDYVFYATNNTVTYSITDGDFSLSFRGFMGVYTVNENGENIYKYVLDGDILGTSFGGKNAVTGKIVSFTEELTFENEIVIKPDDDVSEDVVRGLTGKLLVIDNGKSSRSGSYLIKSAEKTGENITINVGNVTTIRKLQNSMDFSQGYVYMMEEGQSAKISITYSEDFAPVFDEIENLTASVGSALRLTISAKSPLDGVTVAYKPELLPRGANLDAETGVLTWNPSSGQIGDNHFAVTAYDSAGREETLHFYIKVYGSTTSGGGASGNNGNTGNKNDNAGDDVPVVPQIPSTENEGEGAKARFIDLGAHTWAADSINALAESGIIKGTSEKTFSPANNITRADFAILLVRAFEKTSDNTENFSDVSESDYFAKELAIARNTGLVGGIGDNKFAPKANIKRCDMMLMIYRVIGDKLNKSDAPEYADFADAPEYAKEAVSALIGAGLVNGKNGKIAPNDNTTRAEVAVLLKRVLDFIAEK